MNKSHLSPLFKRVALPSLIILYCLTFFSLDQYRLKVLEVKKNASVQDFRAWIAEQRNLLDTRKETAIKSPPLPNTVAEKYPPTEWELKEPHDTGME